MRDHLPAIIAIAIFVLPPLVAIALCYRFDRRSDDPQTGDPMNPEALRDWRKAQWRPK